MFLGAFTHAIDNKCRLTIPSKFREQLENQCVVAQGMDQCLAVYPMDEWEKICEKINEKPSSDPKVRRFKRLFYASASVQEFDKQGRLSIPAALKEYAGIEKDVVIIGESSYLELWSEDRWNAQLSISDDEDSFEELAEFMNF